MPISFLRKESGDTTTEFNVPDQMSNMVDSKNDEAQLDFFCSNRCMMVNKSLKFSGAIVHLFLSLLSLHLSMFPIIVVVALIMSF